jgi:hypothetical protein
MEVIEKWRGRRDSDPPEMAKHKEFTVETDVQVYFCDPQSPWQRGTNENTNLLLRRYFPRGTDLSPFSQAQLDQVSLRLNQLSVTVARFLFTHTHLSLPQKKRQWSESSRGNLRL